MFSGIKLWFVGMGALAILSVVGAGYWYVTGLQQKILNLTHQRDTAVMGLELQRDATEAAQEAIEEWSQALLKYQQQISELQKFKRTAEAERRRLDALFAKHDFTNLANEKPGLIERRINRGSSAVWWMLRCTTGNKSENCSLKSKTPKETETP